MANNSAWCEELKSWLGREKHSLSRQKFERRCTVSKRKTGKFWRYEGSNHAGCNSGSFSSGKSNEGGRSATQITYQKKQPKRTSQTKTSWTNDESASIWLKGTRKLCGTVQFWNGGSKHTPSKSVWSWWWSEAIHYKELVRQRRLATNTEFLLTLKKRHYKSTTQLFNVSKKHADHSIMNQYYHYSTVNYTVKGMNPHSVGWVDSM